MTTPDQLEKPASAPPENEENQEVSQSNKAVLEPSGSRSSDAPYSAFTDNQKRFIVFTASWAGFFSPVSSQIYFPALNTLARELNVSNSLINLTLTSYMVGNTTRYQDYYLRCLDIPRFIADVHW